MGLLDRARNLITPRPHTATDSAAANELAASPRALYGGPGVLTNLLTGLNTSEDQQWWDQWFKRRPLTIQERRALGLDPLVRRILDLPGADATREGWTVTVQDEEIPPQESARISEAVADYEERTGIHLGQSLRDALARARQYGAALVMLGIDDGQAPDQPVNVAKIKRIWWTAVIDRRDFDYGPVVGPRGDVSDYVRVAADGDPADPFVAGAERFGQVDHYIITDLNGVLPDGIRYGDGYQTSAARSLYTTTGEMKIHASRVLHVPGPDALPLLDQLQDAIAGFFRSESGIARAVDRASLMVWKIAGHVAKSWHESHGLGSRRLSDAMRSIGSMSALVIDQKDEDFSLAGSGNTAGLAAALDPQLVWLAGASGIPITRLFGTSPSGWGTGEAERADYNDKIRGVQTYDLAGHIRRFAIYALAAADSGIASIYRPDRIKVEFNPLDPASEVEQTDLLAKKVDALVKLAGVDLYLPTELRQIVPEIELDTKAREARRIQRIAQNALAEVNKNPVSSEAVPAIMALVKESGLPFTASGARAILATFGVPAATSSAIFPDPPPTAPDPNAPLPAAEGLPGEPETPETADGQGADPVVDAPPDRIIPADALPARELAAKLQIPTRRLSLMAERGELRRYRRLDRTPVYSEGDVIRAERRSNMTPEEIEAEDFDLLDGVEIINDFDELDAFDEDAYAASFADLSDDKREERIAEAYKKYHETVNMGVAELKKWAKSPFSKKASLSDGPVDRNLRLLETPRSKWTLAHASSALRTVSFVSRMKKAEQGQPTKIDGREGPSKRDISLKNWAFNPGEG